ncbi:MAG: MFS transporter [Rhodospirillales bacterium]|jgi:MFS transporter, DHA1 family, tetracycline resistance protein|nr:MFS transporter [Rhodospirillales bacterium]
MLPLFMIVLVDLIGFGLYIPLLPFYAEHYQATPFIVGLVMAMFSFAQFISAPFWGNLSDRFGRKPILMIGMAGSMISYIWLAYADTLWMLFAARALSGLMAGNIAAAFAYMADVTTRETRAKGMGMIGAAFGLGFIAGPAIGGILAGSDPANADFQTPALVAAALSATAFILTMLILKESLSPDVRKKMAGEKRPTRTEQFRAILSQPSTLRIVGLIFLATFVFAGLESTFAMWSRRQFGWGPEQNGYLFAFIGIISAIIQGGLIGRMAKSMGEKTLIIQGAAALALGVFLIPFADNLIVLVIAMMIAGYGYSIITPALNSLISLQASDSEQGSTLGVARSASTLARIAGPAWAGMLFSALGMDWPYFGGAIVMLGVIALAWNTRKHVQDSRNETLE